jgi:hypothetical protein
MKTIYDDDGKTVKALEFTDFTIFKHEDFPNRWLLTAPAFGIEMKILGTTRANKKIVMGSAAYVLRMKKLQIEKSLKEIYDNGKKD